MDEETAERNRQRIAELIERNVGKAEEDQVTDLDEDQNYIVPGNPDEDEWVTIPMPGGGGLRVPKSLADQIKFLDLSSIMEPRPPTFIEVHWVVGGADTFECTRGWVISDTHGHDTMIIKMGTEETPGYPRAEIPMSSILWYRVGPGTV